MDTDWLPVKDIRVQLSEGEYVLSKAALARFLNAEPVLSEAGKQLVAEGAPEDWVLAHGGEYVELQAKLPDWWSGQ